MKLANTARACAAFLVIALSAAITASVLSGGGSSSGSYKPNNTDPRTVLVQTVLVSCSDGSSSAPAVELLRERFAANTDGAKTADHAAFTQALAEARQLIGASDLWLTPAAAAQHAEEAKLTLSPTPSSPELVLSVTPSVLDKDVIRAAISLTSTRAVAPAKIDWASTLTLRDGAVIALDLDTMDTETNQPRATLLVVRASIVTPKPN